MGLEWTELDLELRERFAVGFDASELGDFLGEERTDLTANHFCEFFRCQLQKSAKPIPLDLWCQVQGALSKVLCVPADQIKRESWLVKDLGMG